MDVGFIGLGAMGSAMAANLAAAGHRVRAWNRSPGEPIENVERVGSPAEAFDAEVVLTMLSDDAAIREVLLDAGVLDQARPGAVHAVTSTISVAFADELAQAHEAAGVGYVAAPVLGRPDAAAARQLHVLAAGAPEAVERARPVLEAVGQKLWVMGETPRQANAAKVAVNMMLTMAIEALAEGAAIAEHSGVERQAFFDLLLGTLFGARAYQVYSGVIARGDYEPGFKARLGLKDLRLADAAAAETGRTLPMLQTVKARMAEAVDAGLGERDWSVMADLTLNPRD